jgi:hypothetical protein
MAKKKATRKKLNKYQELQKAAKKYCETKSDTAKERVAKKKDAYIKHAVKNGQTQAEATKKANKVMKCKLKK